VLIGLVIDFLLAGMAQAQDATSDVRRERFEAVVAALAQDDLMTPRNFRSMIQSLICLLVSTAT